MAPTGRSSSETTEATVTAAGSAAAAVVPARALDPDRDGDGSDPTTETQAEPIVPRTRPAPELGPASKIDRFVVLEKIGEGGMGTVFAAYDEQLDRKVAVKVVRSDRRTLLGGMSPRERLLREAQAMARLTHPNVVSVLQVGELGDDIYVALEYIDGKSLKRWLREAKRPWREIVDAFRQAGRGLAAAHDAGLVHRDFKPDNVLVGRDGRIQVIDFGIVSMGGHSGSSSGTTTDPGLKASQEHVTFAGLRVGTPAYMAPEQHDGDGVDARADQFAFCVALWEALYGQRPFTGGDVDQLAEAMRKGDVRPPPPTAQVPRWLEAPLRRGLRAAPAQRWPSMAALLAELGRDPAAARRRWLWRGALAVALAGAGATAYVGWTRSAAAPAACRAAERHLAGTWDAARADELRASFAATGLPYQATASTRTIEQLDGWARGWVRAHTATCEATHVHREQSEALLDVRMACLERRRAEVDALADVLVQGEPDVVSRAVEATAALPPLAACDDADALLAAVPPPSDPTVRAQVDALRAELDAVRALEKTGRYPAALPRARAAAERAAAIPYPPIHTEATELRADVELTNGNLAEARAGHEAAATLAGQSGQDVLLADALVGLVATLADQALGGEALAVATAARATVLRAGDRTLEGDLLSYLGSAYEAAGKLPEAEQALRDALALREAIHGPDNYRVAQALNRLAGLTSVMGRAAESRALYTRALAIVETALGPGHPSTAVTRANLCFLDATDGKLREAAACQSDVLRVLEAALGPDHPQVAWALNDAALIQTELGDRAAARAGYERALAIWEKTSGPDHPDVAWPLVNLAELAMLDRQPAQAEPLCRRALAIVEAAVGPDHPDAAHPLACLGLALVELRPREAIAPLTRALALLQATPNDPAGEAKVAAALARARGR